MRQQDPTYSASVLQGHGSIKILGLSSFLWAVGGLVLVYIAIASCKLRYPGLHFDEMLYVNAALGGLDDVFIYHRIADVPFLLMTYIGALKAWLMGPVFALFGVTVVSVRLPMILLTAGAIGAMAFVLRPRIGKRAALAVTALLALDPSLIGLTRADMGPVVLQFVLTVVALSFGLRYVRTLSASALIGLVASLGLGIFNKLNFIWIVNALVAAFVLTYGLSVWRRLRVSLKRLAVHVGIALAGFGLAVGYYLTVSYKFNLFGPLKLGRLDPQHRLNTTSHMLTGMGDGSLMREYWYGPAEPSWQATALVVVGLGLVAGLLIWLLARGAKRQLAFWLLIVVFTLGQIFVTKNANGAWHFAALYPAITVVVVLLVRELYRWVRRRLPRQAWLGVLPYGLLVAMFVVASVQTIRLHGGTTRNPYWSPAIYELYKYTQSLEGQVVSIDWGTHTQLMGLSQDANKYKEAAFFINRDPLPSDAREIFIEDHLTFADGQPRWYVLHAEQSTLFDSARKNFFEISRAQGYSPELVHTIANGGQALFEMYRVQP